MWVAHKGATLLRNGISHGVVTVVISGSLPRSTENVWSKIIASTSMHQPQSTVLTCGWGNLKIEKCGHANPLKAGTIMTEGANMQVKVPCMVLWGFTKQIHGLWRVKGVLGIVYTKSGEKWWGKKRERGHKVTRQLHPAQFRVWSVCAGLAACWRIQ